MQDSYDIQKINDELFYLDSKSNVYKELTEKVYQEIIDQKLRL